jgi:hypothetical protein
MKIAKIYPVGNDGIFVILAVDYTPNLLEKIFGVSKRTKKYLESNFSYTSGGQIKWYNYPEMTVHGRFEELDVWLRKNPQLVSS